MAPPSQAGRFKPRKPAKKIVPGTATSSSADASGGRAPSGRGRGRGGRGGGRGRGRTPMPRGQVFFTGNATPTTAAGKAAAKKAGTTTSKQSAGAKAAAAAKKGKVTIKMEGKHEESDEVIVGELDVAIGAGPRPEKDTDSPDGKGPRMQQIMDETQTAANPNFSIADTYDSDSSEEERKSSRRKPAPNAAIPPSQLPFPRAVVPVGIGPVSERPNLYDKDFIGFGASPFVDLSNSRAAKQEKDSWFLFQFPTRLPMDNVIPPDVVSSEVVEVGPTAAAKPVDVIIPNMLPNSFDDSLSNRAGKLGKLLVYKSGKTILDMGGTRLDVSEGLPCGFIQQAVAIDTDNCAFIPLGKIGKTVVITPDVESAFIG